MCINFMVHNGKMLNYSTLSMMLLKRELLLSFMVFLCSPKLLPTQNCTYENQTVINKALRICSCESSCSYYGDCCESEHQLEFKPMLPINTFQCVSHATHPFVFQTIQASISHDMVGFYLINKCPSDRMFDTDVQKVNKFKCEKTEWDVSNIYSYQERLQYLVPIYDKEKGLIFKNKYCAKCHGYHKSSIQYPNGHVFCDFSTNYTTVEERWELLKFKKCLLKFSFPAFVREHQCYVNLKEDKCFANSSEIDLKACFQSRTNYSVRICPNDMFNVVYRNWHCANCNMKHQCTIDIPRYENLLTISPYANDQSNLFSFDSLIDFSSLMMQQANETNSSNAIQSCQSILTPLQNKVMFIMTSLSLSLSIFGLSALLLVYTIIKELRNIGGMFVMNLSISLLIGLIAFTITSIFGDTFSSHVCLLFVFIKMLFFLSAFSWMLLFGFDLLQAFKRGGIPPKHRGSRSFQLIYLRVSGIGYFFPLVWTLAALIVDNFSSKNWFLKPNFGNSSVCWFGSGGALIFWFFVPLTCAVIINLMILIVLVTFIYRATKQARFASKSKTQLRDTTLVALKITAVLGVTWIASLISELALPINACWPKKLAGLLAALQGFFVACGFLVTQKIGRAIRSIKAERSHSLSTVTSKKVCQLQFNIKEFE